MSGPLRAPIARPPSIRSHVGPIELFYDLVYVFAIIQLSHLLVDDLSWSGAAKAAVVFMAVWWGWNYTAWAMNWLNPVSAPVRLLNAVLMVAGFGMALAVPYAFGSGGWVFAGLYVFAQIFRAGFMVVALRGTQIGLNYQKLLAWAVMTAPLWLIGAFLPHEGRFFVWLAAIALDYAAPFANFRMPLLGSAPMELWETDAEHLAERNRLVYIIALGESILLMGYTLGGLSEFTVGVLAVVLIGFFGLYVQWWNYFAIDEADSMTSEHAGTGALRSAFAYAHALLVAGAILSAVAIEMRLTGESDSREFIPVLIGGPLLYLLGNVMYLRSLGGALAKSRYVAALLLLTIGAVGLFAGEHIPPLLLTMVVLGVMTGLAVYTQQQNQYSRRVQPPVGPAPGPRPADPSRPHS